MSNSQTAASPEQLAANRANAAKSTGPRTAEGKARSAQNARKHGFAAEAYTVVRFEDLQEVAQLKEDAVAFYRPINSQELFAVERIALTQLALLRASRLEAGLFTSCLSEFLDLRERPLAPMADDLTVDIEVTRAQNRNYALIEGLKRLGAKSGLFPLSMRYTSQAERQYRRAVEEFNRLKALRPETPEEPSTAAGLAGGSPAPAEEFDETNPTPPEAPQTERVGITLPAPQAAPIPRPPLPQPPAEPKRR